MTAVLPGQRESLVAHPLQEVRLGLARVGRRDRGGSDGGAQAALPARRYEATDRVEVDLFVLLVRPQAPADVVDAVGDREHSRRVREDIAFEPLQPARRRVAAPAGVDEAHLALGVAQERVVLDVLAVGAGGRDAVAEEDDGVAVLQGEVDRRGRPGDEAREHGDVDEVRAHSRPPGGLTRFATVSRFTNSALSPAFWTRSQIRSRVLNPGSTTPRHDGCARKSYTPPVAITWSSAWPTASRNHSSFHLPVRNATTSLGGLMGISTRPPGYTNGCASSCAATMLLTTSAVGLSPGLPTACAGYRLDTHQ